MDRVAVFIDAGYLFAQGSLLIASEKLARSELNLDYEKVVAFFSKLAIEVSSLELLRIYWYDGTSTGPTQQQLALAYRPSVKLRLGFVNQAGQQKGVDSLIVTDLITLARNRAMADALLLTGDEDIRVGVQQAQEYGVRVHLVGIEPRRENQSSFLQQEADSLHEVTKSQVGTFLTRAVVPPLSLGSTVHTLSPFEHVADVVAAKLNDAEIDAILHQSGGIPIPHDLDRQLLGESYRRTGVPLTADEKRTVRSFFLEKIRQRKIL